MFKKCALFLSVLISVSLAHAEQSADATSKICPASQSASSKAPFGNALSLYDQVTQIVTTKFYDQTFRGLPWPQMVQSYRGCLNASSSLADLESTTNALIDNLKASHTEFVTNADQEYHGLSSIFSHSLKGDGLYQIGAWFEQINGRWFVNSVYEGSPAAKAGLLRGDEIVSADQKPFAPVNSLNRGARVAITIRRRSDGDLSILKVQPRYESIQESLYRATRLSKKIIRVAGKRIAYFHLWSGTDDHFLTKIRKAAAEMEPRTDAFILDLRDGFGGAYSDYITPFLSADPETQKPIKQVYTKPMVILIDEGVRSGKEGISYSLKELKRGKLLGTTTAGHYLAGQFFNIIPNTAALYLAVQKASGGPDIEGKGVSPDIVVENPVPYSEGRDTQFDAALKLLSDPAVPSQKQ